MSFGDTQSNNHRVIPAKRHDRGVTTNNKSHARRLLVIQADPGIQKNSLDTGVRRYDGWTFMRKAIRVNTAQSSPLFERG